MRDGSVLLVEIGRGTLTRVTPDGAVRCVADLGGGPNGAAIGPDGAVYVCNNGGFRLQTEADGCIRPVGAGRRLLRRPHRARRPRHRHASSACTTRVDGHRLRGPNDLVFDAHGGFYFTDLGKVRETEMDRGGVYYAPADGAPLAEIARPVLTPNGIGLSPDGADALLRRDRRRAAVGVRHRRRPARCGTSCPGLRRTAAGWWSRRPAATTSASTRWRSTPSATSASPP